MWCRKFEVPTKRSHDGGIVPILYYKTTMFRHIVSTWSCQTITSDVISCCEYAHTCRTEQAQSTDIQYDVHI